MPQRQRFFFNLGTLAAGTMLVVASVAFGPSAAGWVGFGLGVTGIAASLWFVAVITHHRHGLGVRELRIGGRALNPWSLLGGALAAVAAWQTVQVLLLDSDAAKWVTLSNGLLSAALAMAGLIAHEASSERVVHVLEVVERPDES